jgi:hypothetical protein
VLQIITCFCNKKYHSVFLEFCDCCRLSWVTKHVEFIPLSVLSKSSSMCIYFVILIGVGFSLQRRHGNNCSNAQKDICNM